VSELKIVRKMMFFTKVKMVLAFSYLVNMNCGEGVKLTKKTTLKIMSGDGSTQEKLKYTPSDEEWKE